MKWFDEAPYGMFIHFGLYSQLGGEWKGKKDNEKYAEWIQAHLGIPREEYAETAKTFNPAQFDADLIARTAKEAGMKYLLTRKMLEANPIKKSHPTITAVPRIKQYKPIPTK